MNSNIEIDFSKAIAQMSQSNYIAKLLQLQVQLKVFHWQTYSYSQHQAFGEIYGSLSGLIDQFVEVYQGIYGRLTFNDTTIYFSDLENGAFMEMLRECASNLATWDNNFKNTDLLNIRDEILASINKTLYLLTLS